ncbi:hypothetical protein C9374_005496 [Naegleria lovaniensis]|uniref:Pseudouridine synthase RsuA/RluA-like domain-containing protein n=1 Tax=Naegleria lovaniensis TaxID=51637 RepID=A0AA88KHY8_NAELO|nr:uncharacterized protein C9374_005496 [Naegleria lovaniensis]KAG2382294.1 hypothetical protein C9374_005496 [Naegleria lovaniensis]
MMQNSAHQEQHKFEVSTDYHKERLDVFLFNKFFKERQVSKNAVSKLIQNSSLNSTTGSDSILPRYKFLCNEEAVNKPALKLRNGDYVLVMVEGNPVASEQSSGNNKSLTNERNNHTNDTESNLLDIQPENIPLNILYEDEYLIVLDKSKFMTVHPSLKPKPRNTTGTLVNALLFHCQGKLSSCGSCDEHYRPGIVHRLDRDTSGIMVIAKDDDTHLALKKLFENKNSPLEVNGNDSNITRYYQALVENELKPVEGKIEVYIKRHHSIPSKREVTKNPLDTGAKLAITEYKELETIPVKNLNGCNILSLVQCKLLTGRTHQIRVSFAHLNRPLVGDVLYNPRFKSGHKTKKKKQSKYEEEFEKFALEKGQFLHASYLKFVHPRTGKLLEFSSKTPSYFREAIKLLNHSIEE